MWDILILGGGFAGVWSAAAAARLSKLQGTKLSIALVAPGDDLVIRPRLYEANPDAMRVALDRILEPIGVRRVSATATTIDPTGHTVSVIDRQGRQQDVGYRRLILATGSQLRPPTLPGAQHLYNVDTLAAATALDSHLHCLPEGPGQFTAIVVGAGFTGLEAATKLSARTVAWTAGMHASPLTHYVPGKRDRLDRLYVDEYLSVPEAPEVFAAGDTAAAEAEMGHLVMQSCQHAIPLGQYADHNAAADLLGLAKVPFNPDPYVTCLALGPAGAVATAGWERTVHLTGEEAAQLKRTINERAIYPPVDDGEEILRRADYRTSTLELITELMTHGRQTANSISGEAS